MPRKIVDLVKELEEQEKRSYEMFQKLIDFLREHKDEAFTFQELEDILGFDVAIFLIQNLNSKFVKYYQEIKLIHLDNRTYLCYNCDGNTDLAV